MSIKNLVRLTALFPMLAAITCLGCATGPDSDENVASDEDAVRGKGKGKICKHDVCEVGVKLHKRCDPCVATVCKVDRSCCGETWDDACVAQAESLCNLTCDSGSGGSGSGGSDAGGSGSGGSASGGSDAGGSASGGSDAGGSASGGSDAGGSDAGGSGSGGSGSGSATGGSGSGGSDSGGMCEGASDATTALDADELEFLDILNDYRAQNGLGPVAGCTSLSRAAQGHSEDMRDQNYFSHTSLDGSSPWKRAADACYESGAGGEIIAAGYGSASSVFNGWKNSPGHNAIMLGSGFGVVGIGKASGGGNYGIYWTGLFAGSWEASCD